jgi:adenylate kinase
MALNLFIIGPSGCGKSTQAKLVAEKYNLTHISMGQLLRDEIAAKSGFGDEAKSYIDDGKLVPDDLIFDILINKLNAIGNQNFIIDGFPRVLNQGKFMEFYLKKKDLPFSLLLHLSVTFEEITARRLKAGSEFQKEDAGRTDNTPEAIASRQKFYDDGITPIREYFESRQKFFDVDGNRPIEPIFEDIVKKIDQIK